MKKHGKTKKYMILVISMVLFSQLADSFCAEIYSKMQSFILDDYIIRGTGLDMNEAVSKLGYMMLPFYIVPALSPLARVFVDKYGKNRVMSANFILLIAGCVICAISGNIIAFLIGNAIITFAVSVDIQNMYVARELPKEKRATVRGIMSGVSAGAAMLIPLLRKYLVERGAGWKGIYVAAVPVCVFVLIIVRMVGGNVDTYEKDAEPAGKTVSYQKELILEIGFVKTKKMESIAMDMAQNLQKEAEKKGYLLREIFVDRDRSRDIDREQLDEIYEIMGQELVYDLFVRNIEDIAISLADQLAFVRYANDHNVHINVTDVFK